MQTWGDWPIVILKQKKDMTKKTKQKLLKKKLRNNKKPVIHCNKYRNIFSYDLRSHAFLWKKNYVPTI